jgi:hypothetical protein
MSHTEKMIARSVISSKKSFKPSLNQAFSSRRRRIVRRPLENSRDWIFLNRIVRLRCGWMIGKRNGGKFTTQRPTKIAAGGFPVTIGCHRAIELTRVAFGMPPRAMTAQFSNSNGGMARNFSSLHGKSRTTKPRPVCARAVRFPAGANVAQAFGHDAQAWAKYQCQLWRADFQDDTDEFHSCPRAIGNLAVSRSVKAGKRLKVSIDIII